jgi:release factor glutamine methyltransferase
LTTLATNLNEIQAILQPHSETPRLDAQVLLAHILGKSRTWIVAHPEYELNLDQEELIQVALSRMIRNEALPYVLGHWEFFGLDFSVSPQTLIPRPETELLVEHAIHWLQSNPKQCVAVDIGTGSGIIAICLAKTFPNLRMIATDISLSALQIARKNALWHGVESQISFVQTDLVAGLDQSFDLICANLPYIPTSILQSLPIYDREPILALDGGEDGLSIIRALLREVIHYLHSGSLLLLEIEAGLGKKSFQIANQYLPKAKIELKVDLAGRDRLLAIQT